MPAHRVILQAIETLKLTKDEHKVAHQHVDNKGRTILEGHKDFKGHKKSPSKKKEVPVVEVAPVVTEPVVVTPVHVDAPVVEPVVAPVVTEASSTEDKKAKKTAAVKKSDVSE